MASLARRMLAEAVGTFGLIFAGCGVAVLSGCRPDTGGGMLCIATGFGLAAFGMARAVGPVSGAHLNPAVTLGLAAARRFAWRDVPPYVVAQFAGALSAGLLLLLTAQGRPDFMSLANGFGANGYGEHSPAGYDLPSAMSVEFAATSMLVIVMASVTRMGRLTSAGALVVGPAVAMAHLLALPVTYAALNPARATTMALFGQDWAMDQLWLFWLAPLMGALMGGWVAYCILDEAGTLVEEDEFVPLAPWPDEEEEIDRAVAALQVPVPVPAPAATPVAPPPPPPRPEPAPTPYKGEHGQKRRRRGQGHGHGHGTTPIRP
ncbi:aquaporin Z [Cupriavidus gilardii J11]|uniref:Aquaporin Z n=1 Tax=Cupriavidus gilardii J11 TaxID=936133 RepID=A0A562B7Y4_9BURK|nr:aquaporin Z [Cupriavidus gilardii J11]